jgi:hypothetical protein
MHDADWTAFCDEINEKIKPVNRLQPILRLFTVFNLIGVVAVVVFSLLFQRSTFNRDPLEAGPLNSGLWVPVFIAYQGLMSIVMVSLLVYIHKQKQKAYKVIREVCEETSKKLSLVSFDLKDVAFFGGYSDKNGTITYRNYYIEVTVSDEPNHTTGGTFVGRLQELENIKHLLSTQEYDDKRAEILATV